MPEEVKLNELYDRLASLDYPVSRGDARAAFAHTSLRYADGGESLTAVLDRVNDPSFTSADELETAIYNQLPVEAVGEPGQSEGEG